jgi:hypothetical protein
MIQLPVLYAAGRGDAATQEVETYRMYGKSYVI